MHNLNHVRVLTFVWAIGANATRIALNDSPPSLVKLMWQAPTVYETDILICHFYFEESIRGNTITWEYVNSAAHNPTTWAAKGMESETKSVSTPSSTVSSLSSTVSPLPPVSTNTAIQESTTVAEDVGLDAGVKAGIGAGVTTGTIVFAVLLGWIWYMRRKRQQTKSAAWLLDSHTLSAKDRSDKATVELDTYAKTGPRHEHAELRGSEVANELE
jgi:hypothetical protein